jgi:hypothetical protein
VCRSLERLPLRRFEVRRCVGRLRLRSRPRVSHGVARASEYWERRRTGSLGSRSRLDVTSRPSSRCSWLRPLRVILSCACAPLQSPSHRRPAPVPWRVARAAVAGVTSEWVSGRLPWGLVPIRGISRGVDSRESRSRDTSVLAVSHDLDGLLHQWPCRPVSSCSRVRGFPSGV